jgi:hypothetical protein
MSRPEGVNRSYTTYISLDNLHDKLTLQSHNNIFSLDSIHVPKSYEKATHSSHAKHWQAAMGAELKGLNN